VEAVHDYCARHTGARLAIGEGSGSGSTFDAFSASGTPSSRKPRGFPYSTSTAKDRPRRPGRHISPQRVHIPDVARDAFVISLPVLKDHCFTKTTIAMKNMFGIAPLPFTAGAGTNRVFTRRPATCRWWTCVSTSARALRRRRVRRVVRRSSVRQSARTGRHPRGEDPVAVDAVGSALLGHDPSTIEYIARSSGVLGSTEGIRIVS